MKCGYIRITTLDNKTVLKEDLFYFNEESELNKIAADYLEQNWKKAAQVSEFHYGKELNYKDFEVRLYVRIPK